MTENLLQFIWLYRLYDNTKALYTVDGEPVVVLNPGQLNTNAGPDFFAAKIKIGNTVWVGNIEIHIFSSDWNKHKHESNIHYDRLILHVVYIDDIPVKTLNNISFPTLELSSYLQKDLLERYNNLMQNRSAVPCENNLLYVKPITVKLQLQRMLAERLEEKTNHIKQLLTLFKNSWQDVFYIELARGFGLHINQDAFEELAMKTPLSLFAKHKHSILQTEALLFGQAGFLDDYFDEPYPLLLQNEYLYLKRLYRLEPLSKSSWKFLRLRPANFPTVRIAQFAQLIYHSVHLFSKVISANSSKDIEIFLEAGVSDYWLTHYTFQDKSVLKEKALGKTFMHSLIINVIVPVLFIYGKLQGETTHCDKAVHLLQKLPAEKNYILQKWERINVSIKSAADSQALLQLYKKYCITKKCLSCSIGYEIFKQP